MANFFSVFGDEMFRSDLESFLDALANGDARHDDDKFTPAVASVEFIHSFDIGVSFADARFHFDGEIFTVKFFGERQIISGLNSAQIFKNNFVANVDFIIGADRRLIDHSERKISRLQRLTDK